MSETTDRIRTVVDDVLGKTKAPPAAPDPTLRRTSSSPDRRVRWTATFMLSRPAGLDPMLRIGGELERQAREQRRVEAQRQARTSETVVYRDVVVAERITSMERRLAAIAEPPRAAMTAGDEVRRHEAAHVAAAQAWGVPVRAVWLDEDGGHTEYAPWFGNDSDSAVKRALCVLGEIAETECAPPWPIRLDDGRPETLQDRQTLRRIMAAHRMTDGQYQHLTSAAYNTALRRDYRRTVAAVAAGLEHHPCLDGELLLRGLPSEREHKTFPTPWVTPQSAFDRMGWHILADRDAAIRQARTAQATARHHSAEYKRARAATLALLEAERAKRVRQRMAHDLDLLTRDRVA